ncbi:gamma-glutamylcyclotransferase [Maribius pontilimi]|uniref:Gamma-glutamylcyclotransferase n=1 Tax=Palleronia pontilimi TaxID=1964209 RepID=A0A934IIC1_9RHOB|nr:gamma-glutamylcyclotransferase family protein [Palleronia pontilimi]MBJ3762449.1 gamma-glutamylcyclotransferase [Palleronia pontilimi]
MSDPHFFGYGSLVNVASHGYGPTAPAHLPGWRRRWQATDLRPAAFLTAYRAPGDGIEGLVAPVPARDWATLDQRERGYERVAAAGLRHGLAAETEIVVYAIPDSAGVTPVEHPILLSYLDVVVKGYAEQFGEDGVARFMNSTDGWHLGVADDRAAPVYPRAQDVGDAIRGLTDAWLRALDAQRVAFDAHRLAVAQT